MIDGILFVWRSVPNHDPSRIVLQERPHYGKCFFCLVQFSVFTYLPLAPLATFQTKHRSTAIPIGLWEETNSIQPYTILLSAVIPDQNLTQRSLLQCQTYICSGRHTRKTVPSLELARVCNIGAADHKRLTRRVSFSLEGRDVVIE